MLVQDSEPYPRYYASPRNRATVYRVMSPANPPEWQSVYNPWRSWLISGYYRTEAELVTRIAALGEPKPSAEQVCHLSCLRDCGSSNAAN